MADKPTKVIDLMAALKQEIARRKGQPCIICGHPATREVRGPAGLTVPICDRPRCEKEAT